LTVGFAFPGTSRNHVSDFDQRQADGVDLEHRDGQRLSRSQCDFDLLTGLASLQELAWTTEESEVPSGGIFQFLESKAV
jgi:hypothetical protein